MAVLFKSAPGSLIIFLHLPPFSKATVSHAKSQSHSLTAMGFSLMNIHHLRL